MRPGGYRKENLKTHGRFRSWLKKQIKRQDSVGDFARDFLADECAKGISTLSGIDWHLKERHGAGVDVLLARDKAWREFAKTESP